MVRQGQRGDESLAKRLWLGRGTQAHQRRPHGRFVFQEISRAFARRRVRPVDSILRSVGRPSSRRVAGLFGTEFRRPGQHDLRTGTRTVVLHVPDGAVQSVPFEACRRTVHRRRGVQQVRVSQKKKKNVKKYLKHFSNNNNKKKFT